MGITTFFTLITKAGCFDEFYNLAKEELAFTRQSKGCKSILVSTNRETNTMKMVQFWEDEASYDEYFEKRVERSGADFALHHGDDAVRLLIVEVCCDERI